MVCPCMGFILWYFLEELYGLLSVFAKTGRSVFSLGQRGLRSFWNYRSFYDSSGALPVLYASFKLSGSAFFAAGWLLKRHLPNFRLWLKWYAALFCAVLLGIYVLYKQLYINIAEGRIGNGWEYFFLAFLGIYCCMYLSFLLEKAGRISGIVSLWGRYSFDIMALHFLIFKVLDLLCGILKEDPLELYSAFPQAYSSLLWPLYAVLGTTIPAFLGFLLETAKRKSCRNKHFTS